MRKSVVNKSTRYIKPKIVEQKIEVNFFFGGDRFFDSINSSFVPSVFAQSGCGDCVSCCSCGGCNTCY